MNYNKIGWLSLVAAAFLFFVITPIVKVASADGKADFCYVGANYNTNVVPEFGAKVYYYVESHRPWRPDITVGYASTYEGAKQIAQAAGCPLHTEK